MQNRHQRFHLTVSELAMGRMLRNPEADHGAGAPPGFLGDTGGTPPPQPGGSQQQDGNNQPVIPGQESSPPNRQDNAGEGSFDAASFWEPPASDKGAPSSSDSAAPKSGVGGSSNQDDSKPNIGQQLMTEIESTKFDGVFNEDVAKKLAEGDFDAANGAVEKNLQAAMKASLRHNARLLGEYGKMMLGRIEEIIDDRIGAQVNSDYLVEKIPAASNPKVGPAIRDIYDRALTRTNGDRAKAVEQTKAMMRTLTTELAGDLDLTVAPHDPHSEGSASAKTNWLEELAAR